MEATKFDPLSYIGIPYIEDCYPGRVPVERFREGSNCQLFGLGVVGEEGFRIDSVLPCGQGMRSKELFEDRKFTRHVSLNDSLWRPLDILFFLAECDKGTKRIDFRKLHIGIFVGEVEGVSWRSVLHNAKPGPSSIWPLSDFEGSLKGYHLYGVKRPILPIH